MDSSSFQCKQFAISHKNSAMKVGTDALLLGAWFSNPKGMSVMDIGCGSGILSLMAAQRGAASIVGVDIDALATQDAKSNANQSKWSNLISIENSSIQDYISNSNGQNRYDIVISNPPYFQAGIVSDNHRRALARHTNELSFSELVAGASLLLKEGGVFSVILPYDTMGLFSELCKDVGLIAVRSTTVYTVKRRAPKRILLEFQKGVEISTLSCKREDISIHGNGGEYSREFVSLTKEFYLKF